MMRDGDTVGILDILAHAQRYDISSFSFFARPFVHITPYRDVTFLSHVPWLGAMILTYPELIPAYNKFRTYAQERAMHRLKAGSPYKDIFHHLVACRLSSKCGNIDE